MVVMACSMQFISPEQAAADEAQPAPEEAIVTEEALPAPEEQVVTEEALPAPEEQVVTEESKSDAENAYDLRMQYAQDLIQQDAYQSRMDYYEQMEQKFSLREMIVNYALSFVGVTPYVPGGNSLYTGTDCSGFIRLVYGNFGIWVPAGSVDYQYWFGRPISWEEILPGDIIVYDNGAHVGIYAGYGLLIHCSSPENGTVCWPLNYRFDVTAIIRILND